MKMSKVGATKLRHGDNDVLVVVAFDVVLAIGSAIIGIVVALYGSTCD